MDIDTRAAVQRLLQFARGHSDQTLGVENFLLDWWPRGGPGPYFHLAQIQGLDLALQDDVMTVLSYIIRDNGRADGQGLDDEFNALMDRQWQKFDRENKKASEDFPELDDFLLSLQGTLREA